MSEYNIANKYWSDIYEKNQNIFYGQICQKCRKNALRIAKMSRPFPIPYIGYKFETDSNKILFVGIENYDGTEIKRYNIRKYDLFSKNRIKKLYDQKVEGYSHFWGWVKDITEHIVGNGYESFYHIAYSNLLKCQVRSDCLEPSDWEPFDSINKNCISDAKWIFREIKILKPRNIIIFSGGADDHSLALEFLQKNEDFLYDSNHNLKADYKFDFEKYISKVSDKDRKNKLINRMNGKYSNTDFFIHLNCDNIRIIITNHPKGTLSEFKEEIKRIIIENDWTNSIEWEMP